VPPHLKLLVPVFTQSMQDLVGMKKEHHYSEGYDICFVDVRQLFDELYKQWLTLEASGEHECLDEENKILEKLGIHMPIEFEAEEHPLKDFSTPGLYPDAVDKWLRAAPYRNTLHIDHREQYGVFEETGGRYVLKEGVTQFDLVSIWPKEIYAAVHAARDGGYMVADGTLSKSCEELYKEYMTWDISVFIKRGL